MSFTWPEQGLGFFGGTGLPRRWGNPGGGQGLGWAKGCGLPVPKGLGRAQRRPKGLARGLKPAGVWDSQGRAGGKAGEIPEGGQANFLSFQPLFPGGFPLGPPGWKVHRFQRGSGGNFFHRGIWGHLTWGSGGGFPWGSHKPARGFLGLSSFGPQGFFGVPRGGEGWVPPLAWGPQGGLGVPPSNCWGHKGLGVSSQALLFGKGRPLARGAPLLGAFNWRGKLGGALLWGSLWAPAWGPFFSPTFSPGGANLGAAPGRVGLKKRGAPKGFTPGGLAQSARGFMGLFFWEGPEFWVPPRGANFGKKVKAVGNFRAGGDFWGPSPSFSPGVGKGGPRGPTRG